MTQQRPTSCQLYGTDSSTQQEDSYTAIATRRIRERPNPESQGGSDDQKEPISVGSPSTKYRMDSAAGPISRIVTMFIMFDRPGNRVTLVRRIRQGWLPGRWVPDGQQDIGRPDPKNACADALQWANFEKGKDREGTDSDCIHDLESADPLLRSAFAYHSQRSGAQRGHQQQRPKAHIRVRAWLQVYYQSRDRVGAGFVSVFKCGLSRSLSHRVSPTGFPGLAWPRSRQQDKPRYR